MSGDEEAEKLRREDEDFDAGSSRKKGSTEAGCECVIGVTATMTTYPTSAQSFYAFKRNSLLGQPTEGGGATLEPAPSTKKLLGFNIGSGVPPIGTGILMTYIDNRWIFRYDG